MRQTPDQPVTYPQGVTCWIDSEQPDPQAASEFYGDLFGWTFENAMPPDAPSVYLIAKLDGLDVGAIAPSDGKSATWNTYIAVDDADAMAQTVTSNGGSITYGPEDAGPGGRTAFATDPNGASFRLWQARKRLGTQVSNEPSAWNFSNLRTARPDRALAFYKHVFGWTADDFDPALGAMIHVAGYGEHLANTVDPDIHERQAQAPAGFADVIGGIEAARNGESEHWHVKFTVADREQSVLMAEKLGAEVLEQHETDYTYEATLRDPQGATFTVSQFAPQDW